MITFSGKSWATCGALLCLHAAVLWPNAANAVPVTVTVTAKSGASAQDTVLVFDSLGAPPPAGHDTAIIDQINKQFVPRINVVRTGTVVTFPNSDQIRHQVYSFSPAKVFSLKLYAATPSAPVIFDKPGLVTLGCNIHDKMVAFVAVVDTPYFAKADASGKAVFDLPPGRYRLRVWHPALASAIAPEEIAVDKAPLTMALDIDLDAVPRARAPAPWPE
jgi:plastocyanin